MRSDATAVCSERGRARVLLRRVSAQRQQSRQQQTIRARFSFALAKTSARSSRAHELQAASSALSPFAIAFSRSVSKEDVFTSTRFSFSSVPTHDAPSLEDASSSASAFSTALARAAPSYASSSSSSGGSAFAITGPSSRASF